jgi:hypothetical protein
LKRFIIAAQGLVLAAWLSVFWGSLASAQPVATIALPSPGGTKQLYVGCNNISLTFPDGTPSQTVVQAVDPTDAVEAIWRYNVVLNGFEGFSPAYPQASDLLTVDFLDAVWVCMVLPGPLPTPTENPFPLGTPAQPPPATPTENPFPQRTPAQPPPVQNPAS